jgi:radical SAM superfamily enzyme YgiQ (UPF0313 family)
MNEHYKLLLTGVFGPFGVKDDYAEGLGMQMELLNNQITREQNIHSIRQHYLTLPLYLMAENISVPTVVLDFPSWDDFVEELKNNYTHVGINFIVPNVYKAKRMAEYIRKNYPNTKILLGGYGTIIPELDKIMPFDSLCKGEGVKWLREYFGEDPNAPITHPIIQNPISQSIYGFSNIPKSSVIMPGLGCKNGCDFCITSHKFNKQHIAFLSTGKEIFNVCKRIYDKTGAKEFFIMDENFLKQPERAIQLLEEMEKQMLPFEFQMFSSAEVVNQLGVDFLVRLGVKMIWIGVESQAYAHTKIKGIDLKALIANLQNHGITINTSAILFLDHHTEETIQQDIDWTISLGGDMTQFMNYTPYPTTALYERLKKEGKLKDQDYRFQHGQGELNWVHPHIPDPKKQIEYTRNAFKKKYETSGSAVLNMAITAVNGYRNAVKEYEDRKKNHLAWNPSTRTYEYSEIYSEDRFFKMRIEGLKKTALGLRPVLLTNQVFSPNEKIKKKAIDAQKLYDETFGKQTLKELAMSTGLLAMATRFAAEFQIERLKGNETIVLQPPKQRVEYLHEKPKMVGTPMKIYKPIEAMQIWVAEQKSKPADFFANPVSWLLKKVQSADKAIRNNVLYYANLLYGN